MSTPKRPPAPAAKSVKPPKPAQAKAKAKAAARPPALPVSSKSRATQVPKPGKAAPGEVSKQVFNAEEPELHAALLAVQRELMQAKFPVIVIVSGVEAAGKSAVVNRLNKWLDARGVTVTAFWDESDEDRERPDYWRFWRAMPPKGRIGVFFGSWYTQPIIRLAQGRMKEKDFAESLEQINRFERMLAADGALIVKFWFHISKDEQARRIKRKAKLGHRITPWERDLSKLYDHFARITDRAIERTNQPESPWHFVDAEDARYRDLAVGRTLLSVLKHRLAQAGGKPGPGYVPPVPVRDRPLEAVDLGLTYSDKEYDELLDKYQARLAELHWKAWEQKRSTVCLFEGWDAAGKGGAIRRLTAAMDARLYRVIPVAAPTEEERAQHYLWRFWRHLPRAGYMTIYDRTWYGRVLVERVEGFAKEYEWRRAYEEIDDFERQLAQSGIILCKYWVHISPDEQLRRFEERGRLEHKKHKITEEDWRNREKWDAYVDAVNEMVARTSPAYAPWTVVSGNDKKVARIQIIKTLCKRMAKALDD
jgi:polyphosphate:AMP phosphotransferase